MEVLCMDSSRFLKRFLLRFIIRTFFRNSFMNSYNNFRNLIWFSTRNSWKISISSTKRVARRDLWDFVRSNPGRILRINFRRFSSRKSQKKSSKKSQRISQNSYKENPAEALGSIHDRSYRSYSYRTIKKKNLQQKSQAEVLENRWSSPRRLFLKNMPKETLSLKEFLVEFYK